ncbi:MAG: hypothetical protein K8R91_04840 [Phycisphaerae bacterium]|nr:hypothetical protein [Phycisphaerae bacterium]
MLYATCRCMRPRRRQFVQLFLLVGCFLPLGCGGEKERLVSVKLTQKVMCCSFQRGGIFTGIRVEEARKAGKDHYEFRAFDGELLMVALSGKSDKPADGMIFPYIFRGDEKTPPAFSRRPGLALLNDKVVCVDLADKAGVQWLAQQPDAKLKTIRTLLLSGDAATDEAGLGRMVGSGIAIISPDEGEKKSAKPDPAAEAKVIKALIAAKPTCLFNDRMEVDEDVVVQMSDLTHLVISCEKIPDLTKLKKLRFLGLSDVANLAPLAKLTQLQGLRLECSGVTDFTPLRKLNHLQTLCIEGDGKLADLDVFTDMRELRSLVLRLDKESKIESIAPIGKLTNLTELAIIPIPPTVKDLSPLKNLKNLKMLVVYNDDLKERQKEYDEIRKALPECKVVGYCMGSAWILVVVPAAVGLGIWWRRRSATGKAA